jgi:hypothetical protein
VIYLPQSAIMRCILQIIAVKAIGLYDSLPRAVA